MKYSVFFAHALEAAKQENISIDEVLEKVKEMGYSGFECEYNPSAEDNAEPQTMLSAIKRNGLEAAALYCFFDAAHDFDKKKADNLFRFAADNNIKYVLVIPGMISASDNHDEALAKILEAEKYCVELADSLGIQVTMEDFDSANSPFSTIAGLKYFFDNIPKLRHAFDSGNYFYSGEDCLKAFDVFPEKIAYVHLKDRALSGSEDEMDKLTLDGRKMYACPVGEGVIDICTCIKNLKNLDYNGWMAVEHFGSQHMLTCMERSIENIKAMVENV